MSGHSKWHNINSPIPKATRVWKNYKVVLVKFWSNEINKIPQSGIFYIKIMKKVTKFGTEKVAFFSSLLYKFWKRIINKRYDIKQV